MGKTDFSLFSILFTACIMVFLGACSGGGGDGKGDKITPKTTIVYPKGGDFVAGSIDIAWQTVEDNHGFVEIRLSKDGGQTYPVLLASNLVDGATGKFSWNTTTLDDGNQYQLRISTTDIPGNISVVKTGDFTIDNSPPELSYFGPFSIIGSQTEILWKSKDINPDTVEIRLSDNGGLSYDTVIAEAAPDNGKFDWNASSLGRGSYFLRLVARDAAGLTSNVVTSSRLSLDIDPPATDSQNIYFSNPSDTGITVRWDAANDVDPQLQYRLYYATAHMASVEQVLAATPAADWTTALSMNVTDMQAPLEKFWAVLVRDSQGNINLYDSLRPSGYADSAFGTGGRVDPPDDGTVSSTGAVFVDAADNITVAGTIGQSPQLALWRYDSDGNLDHTFGDDDPVNPVKLGYITHAVPTSKNVVLGAAADGDKIVVLGSSDGKMTLWRLLNNGALDFTFGDVDTNNNTLRLGYTVIDTGATNARDRGVDLVVTAETIFVTGTCYTDANPGIDPNMCIWAFKRLDGSLDTAFNGSGVLSESYGTTDESSQSGRCILADNGKVLVLGSHEPSFSQTFPVLSRYDFTGKPDTGFGDEDLTAPPARTGRTMFTSTQSISASGMGLVKAADKYFVRVNIGNIQFMLIRFLTSGQVDSAYNGNGSAVFNGGRGGLSCQSSNTDAGGRILIAGNEDSSAKLWRFFPDGSPDSSFIGNLPATSFSSSIAVGADSLGRVITVGHTLRAGDKDGLVLWRNRP